MQIPAGLILSHSRSAALAVGAAEAEAVAFCLALSARIPGQLRLGACLGVGRPGADVAGRALASVRTGARGLPLVASAQVATQTIATAARAGTEARLAPARVGNAQAALARRTRGALGEPAGVRVCARSTRLDVGLAGAAARISGAAAVVARRALGKQSNSEVGAFTAGWKATSDGIGARLGRTSIDAGQLAQMRQAIRAAGTVVRQRPCG
jgi:hypothetical protein